MAVVLKEVNYLIYRLRKLIALTMLLALINFFSFSTLYAQDQSSVRVFADDQQFQLDIKDSKVKDVLVELELEVDSSDLVQPSLETPINEPDFNINVYRAQPIKILDSGQEYIGQSAYKSGLEIAQDLGLEVFPEDSFELSQVTNFLEEDFVGLKLEITRSFPYTLNLRGETIKTRTYAHDVAGALKQQGVELAEGDEIDVALDEKMTRNKVITINSVSQKEEVVEEKVAFSEKTIPDNTKNSSFREVQEEGKDGLAKVKYQITYHNNKEVSRKKLSQEILQEPKQQVVKVGTKVSVGSTHLAGATKEQWMAAAGIPQEHWGIVDFIVSRESGWNPKAVNPSSGACGLAQQLPCGKWASYGAWDDPVSALRAQHAYVNGRYGGYSGAYAFWQANHWY